MNTLQNRLNTTILSFLVFGLLMIGMQTTAPAQGDSELNQQLARVRAATAKYHDVNHALENGFVPLTGLCHNGDDGFAVGISYVNVPRFLSAEVNPEEPEFLNYFPTGGGNVRLVGVAYGNRALFRDTRPPDTPGFRPGIFPWRQPTIPAFLEEVSGKFELFGQESRRIFEGRWLYLLTAWVWAENPNGVFADGNPKLRCPENN